MGDLNLNEAAQWVLIAVVLFVVTVHEFTDDREREPFDEEPNLNTRGPEETWTAP